MISSHQRPRNVGPYRAASILYGDLGTSKAYVLGLAFALSGHRSLWFILAVSILVLLVGLNYVLICKYYPSGGGAYTAVRKRSEILSLLGGFFLIADYLVTAALSTLAAFYYFGIPNPMLSSLFAIAFIGFLNYFGPKNTGSLALIISICTFIIVVLLACISLPHLSFAFQNTQAIYSDWMENWKAFTGIIVALSGIEAIANITGIMKLDKGSSEEAPSVLKTSTPAILMVIIEVAIFTTFFALSMQALSDLTLNNHTLSAPGHPEVRDEMLRYMAEVFGNQIHPIFGHFFSTTVGLVFGALLLSATNTAIVALVSLMYVMARDKEFPMRFLKLNDYGVPLTPLILATSIPIFLVAYVQDVAGLVDLYAVGFIGAIAANLGSTSTDKNIKLSTMERGLMFGTFIILLAIEVTLFIDKPEARQFVISIFAAGLLLRGLTLERQTRTSEATQQHKFAINASQLKTSMPKLLAMRELSPTDDATTDILHTGAILCAAVHVGKTLQFAIDEAKAHQQHLYVLFVREHKVITEKDLERDWFQDQKAFAVFDFIKNKNPELDIQCIYVISDNAANTIVKVANELKVSQIILGLPRRTKLMMLIRGDVVSDVMRTVAPHIDVIIIS